MRRQIEQRMESKERKQLESFLLEFNYIAGEVAAIVSRSVNWCLAHINSKQRDVQQNYLPRIMVVI